MTQTDRNNKIMKAIDAKTKSALVSEQSARQTLIDEGIYTKDGDLQIEFGGSEVDILRKNVYDLQKSLYLAYDRVRVLIEENIELKQALMLNSENKDKK